MANTYKQDWASYHPGCMIFLLDQSGSMSQKFGQMQAGRDRRKCGAVAAVVNSFLNELVLTDTLPRPDGTPDVRQRADICVLGDAENETNTVLSGALTGRDFVSLPELQMHPTDIELRKRKDMDETGLAVEIDVP